MPRKQANTNNGPEEGTKDSRPKKAKKGGVESVTVAESTEGGAGKGMESRIAKEGEFRVQYQKELPKAPDNPRIQFEVVSSFTPAGDQPKAIEALKAGIERNERFQTLLGVTGSGKR